MKTASNSLGTILVDSQGMTLYHLSGEQNGKFICTSSACLGVWHPLIAPSSGAPSGEVGSLGTVKRPEGTVQVTYKGTPLYTFTGDQQAGETKGQGIKDVGTWSVITTSSSGTPPSTGSSSEPEKSSGGGSSRRRLQRRRLRLLSPPADARYGARGVIRHIHALATSCLCAVALGGCANQTGSAASTQRAERAAIERYMGEVEPIRLAVNKLLGGADPILEAFHDRRIPSSVAARRMGQLEQRFAVYAVDIAAVDPPIAQLRALNAGYANTYVFEDAYLSALVAGLADGELTDLPNTQAAQRAAIIRWRIGLTVLARAADAPLPTDLQQAGRGEIAPSPEGS